MKFALALVGLLAATAANAVTVNWTDWQSATANTASGQVVVGSDTVDVTFTSVAALNFVQTGAGIDYWVELTPAPYTSGVVDNRPPAAELVSLNTGSRKVISFSQPVTDIYVAFTSWNGNRPVFDSPFTLISQGRGYWGLGSITPNADNTGFVGNGEFHGILLFSGTFTSLGFTDTSENWHGLTLGFAQVADPDPTPAPAALALFGLGVLALGAARRR